MTKPLDIPKSVLEKLYLEDRFIPAEIAPMFNLSRAAIAYKLRRYNIPTRNQREAIQVAAARGRRKAEQTNICNPPIVG